MQVSSVSWAMGTFLIRRTATGATPDFFNDVGANRVVHGWAEKQNFVLEHDLFVDAIHAGRYNHKSDLGGYNQLKIDKGTVINSQLLSFDPLRRHSVSNVTFTFDAPILGVIVSSNRFRHSGHPSRDYLFASDFLGNPQTTYPTHHYRARGLEAQTCRLVCDLGAGRFHHAQSDRSLPRRSDSSNYRRAIKDSRSRPRSLRYHSRLGGSGDDRRCATPAPETTFAY